MPIDADKKVTEKQVTNEQPTKDHDQNNKVLPEDMDKPASDAFRSVDTICLHQNGSAVIQQSTNKESIEKSDLINLIITENRLQNTEMRMSMMKMNERLDQLLAKREEPTSPGPDLKRTMNKMFKQLKSEINPDQTYTGQEVIDIFAACVKSSTEWLLQTNK